jgi:hypothetical protein
MILFARSEEYRIVLHMYVLMIMGTKFYSSGSKHELSSPAQALGLWLRIPFEAWLFAFILCLCCPVYK